MNPIYLPFYTNQNKGPRYFPISATSFENILETVSRNNGFIPQFQENSTGLMFQYLHPGEGGHATPPAFRVTGVQSDSLGISRTLSLCTSKPRKP